MWRLTGGHPLSRFTPQARSPVQTNQSCQHGQVWVETILHEYVPKFSILGQVDRISLAERYHADSHRTIVAVHRVITSSVCV
jgi:hypothetical protein